MASMFLCVVASPHVVLASEIEIAVKGLIMQFTSAMNLRQKSILENFIKYYADDGAIFEKHSILLDSDNPLLVKAEKKYKFSKKNYIEHLYAIISYPVKYSFTAKIQDISVDKNHNFAIAKVAIEETSISNVRTMMIKTAISTNCNFIFNIQQMPFLIAGNNCVEKILIK